MRTRTLKVSDKLTVPSDRPRQLSFAQERLFFLDQLDPTSPAYHIAVCWLLRGSLNQYALESALCQLVSRHEALRTTIDSRQGKPWPTITDQKPRIHHIDLRERRLTVNDQQVTRLLKDDARRLFDLSRDLMLRATLLRLSDDAHILLLTMHHIASDAWSLGILASELEELYAADLEGRRTVLPKLEVQFTEYARRERERLQGKELEQQLRYWRRQLANAPPILELATDHPRPARQSFQGASESFEMARDLCAATRILSKNEGCTLFMTLVAALNVLLHRYTAQDDILVGTPIANRDSPEAERLIGFLVNTLVLRTSLSGDPSFRQLMARVRRVALDAYSNRDLPFEKLISELRPERSLSHSPIFQVMLAYYDTPIGELVLPGIKTQVVPVGTATAKFDLAVAVVDGGDHLRGHFEYNIDLFEHSTIQRMIRHFRTMLEAAVAEPDRKISKLNMLTERERRQVLVDWQDTSDELPLRCTDELFEEHAARTPDATAVVWETGRISYRELNEKANRLAHHLRALGVGGDVLVGLSMDRSPEMLVGLLSIWKAGGAFVPLNPEYPIERLAFMIEDAGLEMILTREALRDRLPPRVARVVSVDQPLPGHDRTRPEIPASQVRLDSLAYVIYTSGSTGRPKGVLLEHRGLSNLVQAQIRTFRVSAHSRVLQFASLSFDASLFEIVLALGAGATLCLPPPDVRVPGPDLVSYLEKHAVSAAFFLPSALAALPLAELPALKTVVVGGEACPPELASRWGRGRRFFNGYGTTEATIWTTIAECSHGEQRLSVGRPIANATVYILDRHLGPLPVGVPGEICVGGVGVARGYLRRPELSQRVFIPDPFSPDPAARLYRTGDLGRFLPNGAIEILGRLDDQVKVRGFRIEPGEIEAVLREHPAVSQVAVIAREEAPGSRSLTAYVVPSAGRPLTTDGLRDFLRRKLPAYMMPSRTVFLESLPRTSSGKLDRDALPTPEPDRPKLAEISVAPRDPLELRLAGLWERKLNVRPIGITDNFFDLGGHSLMAGSLFADMEKVFGMALPLSALFEAPTVERMAQILRQEGWKPRWSSLVPIQPSGSRTPFFCVHAAQGNVLFYADLARHLGSDHPVYGLQSAGLDGSREPYTRVEDMAGAYIRELKEVQPNGPYSLGGFCSGAYVALEMAYQLQERGDPVALLVSFTTDGAWKKVDTLAAGIGYHWRNLSQLRPCGKCEYLATRIRYRATSIAGTIIQIARWLYRSLRRPLSNSLLSLDVEEANRRAIRLYQPHQYRGKLIYFQGSDEAFRDPAPFWGDLVEELEIHRVPGSGNTIFREPNVRVLADRLRRHLEHVDEPTESPERETRVH